MQNQSTLRKIRILLYRSELNIILCKEIYQKLNNEFPLHDVKKQFLALSANNSFFDSLSIIHTLIGKDKQEINLMKLGKKMNELDDVRQEYIDGKFQIIRDKIGDHKDKDDINCPSGNIWNLIRPDLIDKLSKIQIRLTEIFNKYSDEKYDPINPFRGPFIGIHEIFKDLE